MLYIDENVYLLTSRISKVLKIAWRIRDDMIPDRPWNYHRGDREEYGKLRKYIFCKPDYMRAWNNIYYGANVYNGRFIT